MTNGLLHENRVIIILLIIITELYRSESFQFKGLASIEVSVSASTKTPTFLVYNIIRDTSDKKEKEKTFRYDTKRVICTVPYLRAVTYVKYYNSCLTVVHHCSGCADTAIYSALGIVVR